MEEPKEILRNSRIGRGLTLKKVSDDTEIPLSTINSWERGVGTPKGKNKEVISKYYSLPPGWLERPKEPVRTTIMAVESEYSSRPIMLHKKHWELAEELRPTFDAEDMSMLVMRLLVDAKRRPTVP